MTPKERVRVNVYKSLLQEEKKKNKKFVIMGASLFVIGIFSDTMYEMTAGKLNGDEMLKNTVAYEQKIDLNNTTLGEAVAWEKFYENDLFKENEIEINPDELFVSDFGI
jgi:hypothetical protein